MRRIAPALALLLGSCGASHHATPVSGPPSTEPEVLAAVVDRVPYQSAPTATVAPTTTHTHPTTTAVVPLTTSPPVVQSGNVHSAIAAHFGTGGLGQSAQRVAQCESQMNAGAKSRTNDHGLFQIHAGSPGFPGGWVETFQQVTGVPFYNGVYDANLNAQFARWLYDDAGGWGPWTCRSAA